MSSPLHPPAPISVAIVEDEEDLRSNLTLFLQGRGFDVWSTDSAEGFYRLQMTHPTHVVLIDLGLPGEDGLSLVRYLRQVNQHRLIILTARGSVNDRVAGLDAGADQYFVKPVNLFELAAGIQAVTRAGLAPLPAAAHPRLPTNPQEAPNTTPAQAWVLQCSNAALQLPGGQQIYLTSRELELLRQLMTTPNATLAKTSILQRLGLSDSPQNFHRVEATLSRLRKKVELESDLPLPVRSVFGKGLVFTAYAQVV